MTISKKPTAVRRICPCITAINNEVLNDFIDSYYTHTKEKFSIAKAFKDYIVYDCATYTVTKNNSNTILKQYNQIISLTTNNYSSYIKNKPEHKTEDATKIIHALRQSRVDISKYFFSSKTFRADPSINAICLTEAMPLYDTSKKSKKLNLTYSEKDFAAIKSKFKSLKRENKTLTFDDLFFQFMSELKIYQLTFETTFFSENNTEITELKNIANEAHKRFSNLPVESFNKYFLEVFPRLHNRIVSSLGALDKMISIEV